MNTKNKLLLKKISAIFAIYLILSLTFITAKAFAVLNYEISGDKNVLDYARQDNDNIKITTVSDSDVSFIKGGNTIPLNPCTNDNGVVHCTGNFPSSGISAGILSFTLQQSIGSPLSTNGMLYVDNLAPVQNTFDVQRMNGGLNFVYDFTDYLTSTSETDCMGSGIGTIELFVQGIVVFRQIISTQNCTVAGSFFKSFSNTPSSTVSYKIIVTDRVGNKYSTDLTEISGDFNAPIISNGFKIMQGEVELKKFSQTAGTKADVVIEIEETNLDVNNVYGDLSNLNTLLKQAYTNIKADECLPDAAARVYTCKFKNVELRPASNDLSIVITASDIYTNIAVKTLNKTIELSNGSGQVSYIGPLKTHCTTDLTQCYLKSGKQLLTVELDDTSSYAHSIIYIGANDETRFAICKLTDIWKCIGIYDILPNENSVNVFLAESYDDYGNLVDSSMTKMIVVDNLPPKDITAINATNSNNNIDCSLSGDQLELKVKILESTPEPKIYINTSKFTSQDIQTGTCIASDDGTWDCTLIIKNFISVPISLNESIIVEDLAGNKLQLTHKFEVCKASSATTPNVISGITQGAIPIVDRRTASLIPIRTYLPLSLDIKSGATIIYLTVDRCVGLDMNNMDAIGSGQYFIPNYGNSLTLVTNIGNTGRMLPENKFNFNCTISAKIRQGSIIFTISEKETIMLTVDTFNQPLGVLDATTLQEIKTQKETLRSMDKEIKTREDIHKILKTICDISNILVKLDGILQIVKSVIYAVAVVFSESFGENLWEAVAPPISKIDNFVQTFVWPTGMDPKAAVGYAWKYTCIIYNCKFYTLSGLIEIGSDAVNGYKTIKDAYDKKTEGRDPLTITNTDGSKSTTKFYKDGSTETTTPNNDGTTTIDRKNADESSVHTVKTSTSITTTTTPPQGSTTPIVNTIDTLDSKGKIISSTQTSTLADTTVPPSTVTKNYDPTGKIISSTETTITKDGNDIIRTVKTTDAKGITTVNGFKNTETTPYYTAVENTKNIKMPFLGLNTGIKRLTVDNTNSKSDVGETVAYTYNGKTFNGNNGVPLSTSDDIGQYNLESEQRQELLYSEIDRQDWIINPYKSKYYDGLCAPATLYNLQKERQIRCMYLSCLQTSQRTGLSNTICKDIYTFNDCLYLESAQYRLNKNVWKSIGQGLVNQAISASMGLALHLVFNKICAKYNYAQTKDTLVTGPYSVGCGLFSGILKFKEIHALLTTPGDVLKDLFKGTGPKDPASINDYCNGGELYAE